MTDTAIQYAAWAGLFLAGAIGLWIIEWLVDRRK